MGINACTVGSLCGFGSSDRLEVPAPRLDVMVMNRTLMHRKQKCGTSSSSFTSVLSRF